MKDGVIGARRVPEERHMKVLEKLLEPFAYATLLAVTQCLASACMQGHS